MRRPIARSVFLCCILVFGYIQESKQLVIKSIDVPPTVKVDDKDYVVLDCDYDLEDTPSQGLVVQWFFNTNELVYQWIAGRNNTANELLQKYIDLTYKASDNPLTKYRAMKLNKPGVELTGEYKCVVSTFADECTANASMVVYSTEEKFELVYQKKSIEDKDGVEVTCLATGLYPQPTLDISVGGVSEKQAVKPSLTQRKDGLYDILSRMTLLDEDMGETAIVKCSLSIPKAYYTVSRKTVYYPGISTTTASGTTKLLGKMEIQKHGSQPGNGGASSAVSTVVHATLTLLEVFLLCGIPLLI